MAETVHDRINRYIEDAIAAERNFENALESFGNAGNQQPVQRLLSSFSAKARTQHERLTRLLEGRGRLRVGCQDHACADAGLHPALRSNWSGRR